MVERAASTALGPSVVGIDTVVGWRQFSIHSSYPGATTVLAKLLSINSKGIPHLLEIVG